MTTDKQLVELERKVEALRLEIRERERRLNERIDKIIAERQADRKKKEEAKKLKVQIGEITQPLVAVGTIDPPSLVRALTESPCEVRNAGIEIRCPGSARKLVEGKLVCIGRTGSCHTLQYAIRTIDQKLGAFYGSSELKEAIKDAQAKMHSTTGALQKVREHSHTPFVRKEIEHLFKTVGVLTQIFNRMLDRMELPNDGEEFFLDDILHK